ncbi:uncharacterized protein FTOL_05687 [Fusarium torulosum]|uniref:3CxxC-type domain-containing protein n=1 Tax=Fusarium torulosum TaxID=33205 RepID=A0AAE8M7P2_9HYPO|nr:uncharacterized protein FTOL_05687 [Fusarium torulosum]
MPRKRSKAKEGPSWAMYPELHDEVAEKLEEVQLDYSFSPNDNDIANVREYDTNIMGRFTCNNEKCKKEGWSTQKMAMTIREYTRDRYNARVYFQRCIRCKSLGQPTLDEESYIERVAYRIKKWNGVEMEKPIWSGASKGPHETDFCEGCINGHCSQGVKDRYVLA